MFRNLVLGALVLLVVVPGALFAKQRAKRTSEAGERGPIILCYHHVGATSNGRHALTREAFTAQMKYLADNDYNVITMSQLNEYLTGRAAGPLPANTVVVTVDDGWRSTFTEILPIMRRFGFSFTAFIYPKFIGGGGSSLSWDEVRALLKEGVDVQSHTYSHSFLTKKRYAWRRHRMSYAEWLNRELRLSREIIEREIGRPVRFLAYPYGDYDTTVARATAAAGYHAAVTCNHGPITPGADPFRLRRFAIDRYTTMTQFARYVGNSGPPHPRPKEPTILLAKKPAAPTPRAGVQAAVSLHPNAPRRTIQLAGLLPLPSASTLRPRPLVRQEARRTKEDRNSSQHENRDRTLAVLPARRDQEDGGA